MTALAHVGLNRSERLYLALESVAGAIGQIHVLRFHEPHAEADVRAGLRHLVRLFPRLRGLVEPTALGHRLAVLPEGARVDALFESAFRAVTVAEGAGDAARLQSLLDELANEPFDLARALPLRARFLTGGPRPVLVLSLHHVVCDGRGMLKLLDALMAHLNGEELAAQPLDDPGMRAAFLPTRGPWRQMAWQRGERAAGKQSPALTLVKERGAFGPTSVRLHDVSVPLAAIKQAAAARGCTVSELVIAALGASFAGRAAPRARAVGSVRVSVDLRPYFPPERRPTFGNYVASFLVRVTRADDLEAALAEVHARMREVLGRFERREMGVPLLLAELAPRLLGRRLLGWCVRALKRRGRLAQVTVHCSNLGDADLLNGHGATARADALAFVTPALGPYVGSVGLGGRMYLGVTYPRAEIDETVIDGALADFERGLRALTGTSRRMASGRSA